MSDTASPLANDLTGQTVGDFLVIRKIGQGGMGQVYLAEQVSLKRKVALKLLRDDHARNPVAVQRFQAEAEAVARVTHPNIVNVYAIGEDAGRPYMALEYVESRNLRDYILKKGPLELPVALMVLRQVAAALQRASESGIVHRDIKPENVLLSRKGEVKVTDFGLSRIVQDEQPLNLTQTGMTMGTPLYMSPEQVQGKPVDPRTDIYSLGVTAYHMLAGEPPYKGTSAVEVAMKHVSAPIPSLADVRPDLPLSLVKLVARMMAKKPDDRPQTGREILRDLAAGADATEPLPKLPEPVVAAPAPRWPWVVALLGIVVVGLLGGFGIRMLLPKPVPVVVPPAPPPIPAVEQELLDLVKSTREPTPARIRDGLGYHIDLGLLYLNQHRWADAERYFEELRADAKAPEPYHTLGDLGLAIVASHLDKVEESNRRFLAVVNDGKRFLAFFTLLGPARRDTVDFRDKLVTALERNAKSGALPAELDKVLARERGLLRLRPGRPKDRDKEGKAGTP